jgi:hypothetical protein
MITEIVLIYLLPMYLIKLIFVKIINILNKYKLIKNKNIIN